MERKKLIAGNWKMNTNHLEGIQMVQKLSYRLEREDYDRVEVVVCPPFTSPVVRTQSPDWSGSRSAIC